MGISRGETLRAVWRNSRLISVRRPLYALFAADWRAVDMLTPIDEPLDKLEDLTPEEMLGFAFCRRLCRC
jgi:hypothetical protein